MIHVDLCECCYKCKYPDVQIETINYADSRYRTDDDTNQFIACARSVVCKYYIEENENKKKKVKQ